MVYRTKPGHTFKLRVTDKARRSATLSTGTTDRTVADDVESMVKGFRAQRKWSYLAALVAKLVPLADAYDAHVSGELEAFMAAALERRAVVDLDPLVTEWAGQGADTKYVKQVRRFIPAGAPFPLTDFRVKTISTFLDRLTRAPRSEPAEGTIARANGTETRRRYKTAISRFAAFLIRRELIEVNPTRSVELPKRKPRPVHFLEPDQIKAGVLALEGMYRAAAALTAGSAMEFGSLQRARKRDVRRSERMVHAHGSKTEYRDRWVEVTEDWAWAIVDAHAKTVLTPGALLFPGLTEHGLLDAWQAALKAAGAPRCTVHEIRHAFAVMWINRGAAGGLREDGRDLNWLKNQLGHSERSVLVFTTYGVQIKAARLSVKQRARLSGTSGREASQ